MNILDEWWKRVLISIFLGKVISESLRFITLNKVGISAILITLILYFVLTGVYNRSTDKIEQEKKK